MPKPIDLPTRVLIAEGEQQIFSLQSDTTKERRDAMNAMGLDTDALTKNLESAVNTLKTYKVMQERKKTDLYIEHAQDRELAAQGYRYKLATDARIRAYLTLHPEHEDMRPAFRFRKLRAPRRKAVLLELHNTLAELENHQERLAAVGIDEVYRQKGHQLVEALNQDNIQTQNTLAEQKQATQKVRAAEQVLSDAFRRLMAFDKAAALEAPDVGRVFNLHIIKTEIRRTRARNEATKTKVLLNRRSS